nr:hypothetical protein BaRGS_013456 [Batillaria attramentaria]
MNTETKYITHICGTNPQAKIPSPDSCHTYLDCSNVAAEEQTRAEFVDYLLECPYPDLFSSDTGQCQHFSFVSCRHRLEPKAPCDYFQYLQLYDCSSKNCTACTQHHPSCRGLSDGSHAVVEIYIQ